MLKIVYELGPRVDSVLQTESSSVAVYLPRSEAQLLLLGSATTDVGGKLRRYGLSIISLFSDVKK